MSKKYYITTPIYYASGDLHIGHCYTTVICDAISRFKRMNGYDVFYLTGTDEHGQKVEQKAIQAGKTPKQYVDDVVSKIKDLWKLLDIQYDKFIRTTDDYHEKAVQKIMEKLLANGDLYKDAYEGWYCTPCESFWTESQLKDGKCPDCGREVKLMKEESYFFRLSKYQDRLVKYYEENPEFISPKSRMNEMINNFIKPGLKDLCVSRTSFKWGIPLTFDDKHVVYVWVDALSNYITALGYLQDNDENFKKYWPADLHMVGKEIVRFHTIIWPALLMALDLPLPKQVYGHGWLLLGGDKMSKSKTNVVDPHFLVDRYGIDAMRYYLLREIPFGSDGTYTNEMLIKRINTDLANIYGNLVHRTLAMLEKYYGGVIPAPGASTELDEECKAMCEKLLDKCIEDMDKLDAPRALSNIMDVLARANKYIEETSPWTLDKNGDRERLGTVMYNLCEMIRVANVMLQPYITESPKKVFEAFGTPADKQTFESVVKFGGTIPNTQTTKMAPLFGRIDEAKEIEFLNKYSEELAKKAEKKEEKKMEQPENTVNINEITIDQFMTIKLKVGEILTAEKVENADKLLKFSVKVGEETRTIVSGIAKYYTPEELIGQQVVVVANLKPAKLRGIESQGMLLCACNDEDVVLVAPIKRVKDGSEVR